MRYVASVTFLVKGLGKSRTQYVRPEGAPNAPASADQFDTRDEAEHFGQIVAGYFRNAGHSVERVNVISLDGEPLKLRGSFRGSDWFNNDPANWAPSRES